MRGREKAGAQATGWLTFPPGARFSLRRSLPLAKLDTVEARLLLFAPATPLRFAWATPVTSLKGWALLATFTLDMLMLCMAAASSP